MIFYIVVYVAVLIISFFSQGNSVEKNKLFFLFTTVFLLSILYIIRDYSIGTDTVSYVDIFRLLDNEDSLVFPFQYSIISGFELGFTYLSFFLVNVFHHPYFLFLFFSIIIYSSIWYVFNKINLNTTILYASLFSVFPLYFYAFNILRQSVAIALVMVSVIFLLKSDIRKFIYLVIFASLFHYSAILCIGFYCIYKYRNLLYKMWFVIIPLVPILAGYIFNFLVTSSSKYSLYSTGDDVTGVMSLSVFFTYIIIFLFSILFVGFVRKDRLDEFKFFSIIFYFFIGLQLFFFFSDFLNQAMSRFSLYFLFPIVFIPCYILNGINNKSVRYILNLLYLVFLSFYFVFILYNKGVEYLPFRVHGFFNLV